MKEQHGGVQLGKCSSKDYEKQAIQHKLMSF